MSIIATGKSRNGVLFNLCALRMLRNRPYL